MHYKFFVCTSVLLFFFVLASAQENSFYVVIGVFKEEANAQKLRDHAHSINVAATYSFNAEKQVFYVFVRNTSSREAAYATFRDVQSEGFRDAWVLQAPVGTFVAAGIVGSGPPDNTPVTELTEPEEEVADVVTADDTALSESPAEDPPSAPAVVRPAGKPFVFRLLNEATGNPVIGQVRLQEAEKSNQFRPYESNETVYVVPPNNRTGRWYVVCQVVGFRPYKRQINYNNPERDGDIELGPDQEIILPVRLTRVRRGDYIEMDGVRFMNNTSVFTPESKRELAELLAMMTENPGYRIRLHGHTNGNDGREIIDIGQNTDFFALSSANERRTASAKELSELRAEAVRKYLVANGIDGERIAVKGEGGKQPIFDPGGTNAGGNDRVEVEITKH